MSGFMLDTCSLNKILDETIDLELFKNSNKQFYVTHIQEDEINNTKDNKRKDDLLKVFKRIGSDQLATESAAYNVSRYDQAKYTAENGMCDKIKKSLDDIKKKRNNNKDALIAETAVKNGLTLVTEDEVLFEVVKKYNGNAIGVKDLFA